MADKKRPVIKRSGKAERSSKFGIKQDITKGKRIEAEVQGSESKFSTIFSLIPDPTTITDIETGRIIDLNEAAARWFGLPREKAIGMTTFDAQLWVDPADRGRLWQEIQEKGEIVDREFRLRKHSGEVREMFFSSKILEIGGKKYLLSCAHDITERKKAEDKLSHNHNLMQYIISHTRSAIAVHDRDMKYVYVSNQYLREYKVKERDVIGKRHYDVFPDLPQKWRDVHQRVLAGAVESNEEDPYVREDGSVDWTRWECRPWYESDGSIGGLIVYTEVITERKRAEEALRARENLISSVLRAAPIGIGVVSNRVLMAVNNRICEMVGFTEEELIGKSARVLYPSDADFEYVGTEKYRQIAGRGTGEVETRWQCRDGRVIDVLLSSTPITPPDLAAGVTFTALDITERKRAEEALRENQARLDLALQSAHMGVWRWEIRENRRYFDELTCQLLGVEAATFTGTVEEFFRTVHPEDCEKIKAALARTLEQDVPYEPAYRVVWPDGRVRFITARGRLFRDDNGQPARINGILWDITDQRLMEQEHIKTQKLESIGTLAGGIAHDFNNLLQGIFGYISMAKMTLGQREKSQAMLEQAEKALHQSVNLTTQLLTFSKGGKPVKKLIELRLVIANSVKFTLSGSRSDFRLNIPEDLWQVEADAGQVGQVIQNIVLNADQAMPVGGTVGVTAANMAEGDASLPPGLAKGDYVVLAIQDTGVGIPEQYLSKIFDPYFTTKEKGSGLGLATSYSIVRNHGGMIDVRTKSGEGSTFMIYLPAVAGETRIEAAAGSAKRSPSRTAKVLVMDDEELIRNLSSELLGVQGHDVEVAKHGQEALEKYQEAMAEGKPFDIVILDLTIRGGMGGSETVQKLLDIDPAVKAIVSSGYSDDATTSNYEKQGFKAFLKKPYDVDGLTEVLSKILNI